MTENNAITALDFTGVNTKRTSLAKYGSGASKFLRRIQLCGGDRYVKAGKIKPGRIGVPLSDEEVTDLGESVDLILFAVRDKCIDLNQSPPLSVYNPEHPEYQRIFWETYDLDTYLESGGELDENNLPGVGGNLVQNKDTGTMQGPSFLVFERSTGEMYELFFGNASGREEAKRMEVFLPIDPATAAAHGVEQRGPIPCTLKGKFIQGKKFQWWAPETFKCSERFTNLQPATVIMAKINEFVTADVEGGEDTGEKVEGKRKR